MAKLSPSERKAQAQALQSSELLTEIFDELRADLVDKWVAATTTDKRERMHAEVTSLTELKARIYAAATARNV